MRILAALAAALLFCTLPVLAQQPVYPSFPAPPAASGDQAPHTGTDSRSYPDPAEPTPQNAPDQQKPTPYPQDSQQQGPQQQYPQQSAPAYAPPANSLNWIPQGMEALGRTAAFHTDFTFDRSMLALASGLWESPGDPSLNDALSRLDGIALHSYHYAAPGMYDPRLVDAVRQQYTAMGWQHLVAAHSTASGGATDLWISFHHLHATGAVVLFQSPTNLNLIAFSGNLSPIDLLHLRGHFGIPRFPGDRFVPAPDGRAATRPY